MTPTIKPVRGHWEVYIDGIFYCSADSESEAEMEYQIYLKERNANEIQGSAQELQYN